MILKTLRLTFLFVWIVPCLLAGVLHGLIRPFHPDAIYLFAVLWGPLGAKVLGFDYEIRHHDRLVNSRPCVIIANHQTNYDLLMACLFRVRGAVSLGKRELLKIPIFGLFYWITGNIMIERGNKKKAAESMAKVKAVIKEKKLSMLIMPEGTRNHGRGLLPFKRGAFLTAINAEVPIVPLVISSWHNRIDLRRWHAGKIIIDVLPPISVQGLNDKDAEKLSDQCRQLIQQNFDLLEKELNQQSG